MPSTIQPETNCAAPGVLVPRPSSPAPLWPENPAGAESAERRDGHVSRALREYFFAARPDRLFPAAARTPYDLSAPSTSTATNRRPSDSTECMCLYRVKATDDICVNHSRCLKTPRVTGPRSLSRWQHENSPKTVIRNSKGVDVPWDAREGYCQS
ncbi:hypothetical protein L596_007561 [Steinernema carpocapsae]|uniref:Uncharacterized protein n=1 Tax=Steinernema carpocapsae TaxID=34508 RepID=A0A4U5P9S6_STECR|nr:hypothetical protein L596_007561 [Steinernema carpocapsae]